MFVDLFLQEVGMYVVQSIFKSNAFIFYFIFLFVKVVAFKLH
jgi:hypothetical protein